MKKWIFFPAIVILAVFQVTVLDYFKIFGIKPDLLLVSVVITSLTFSLKWALLLSVFAGILKDAFGINTFGINSLIFALWSFLIIKLSKKISLDYNLIRMVLVFIIVVFNDIAMRLIFSFLGDFFPVGIFLRVTFLESLYTALVMPLVFKVFKCA